MRAPAVPDAVKRAAGADCASGYVFDWTLHIACNYRCEYCYFDGNWSDLAGKNRIPPLEEAARAWEEVYERYGECYVLINGGEPTVYPRFSELMGSLGRRHRWSFNTNLWWGIPRWREFADRVDVGRGSVQFSYHPTQDADFDDFRRRAKFVNELGFRNCTFCVVAYPGFMERLRHYCLTLRDKRMTVRPQPFVGKYSGRDYPAAYSEQERALIRDLNGETESSLKSELSYAIGDWSPFGKPCRTGQYYAFIDQRGDVYRCTQSPQGPEDRLGNLYDGFELTPQATPCPLNFCKCGESKWLVERCG
jgi:MoaA/NifB/PqqE/SkfB family radical SAM enzyme